MRNGSHLKFLDRISLSRLARCISKTLMQSRQSTKCFSRGRRQVVVSVCSDFTTLSKSSSVSRACDLIGCLGFQLSLLHL